MNLCQTNEKTPQPSLSVASEAPRQPTNKSRPLAKTDFSEADQKRFWSKVDIKTDDECWPYMERRTSIAAMTDLFMSALSPVLEKQAKELREARELNHGLAVALKAASVSPSASREAMAIESEAVTRYENHQLRTQLADARREMEGAREDSRELRVMCAVCHADTKLYADDGELQDNTAQPFIDWKRDSIADIQEKLTQRALADPKVRELLAARAAATGREGT